MTLMMREFEFEGFGVRMEMRDDEPWFVLADVCRVLEHSNSRKAAERLDDDEKGVTTGYTLGGKQEMTVINESGLYSLILTSRKEAAKRFKRWVTHEVLPTLRKTGIYSMREEDPDLRSLADGKVFGCQVAKINAAARLISVVNGIYGPEAARALYESEPGLPPVRHRSVNELAGTADDDPQGCLNHLLRIACGNGRTVGQVLSLAMHDDIAARSLPDLGIALDPVGGKGRVAIASDHTFLRAAWLGTQWEANWTPALLQLPDAKAGKARIGGKVLPVVTIPKRVIAELA